LFFCQKPFSGGLQWPFMGQEASPSQQQCPLQDKFPTTPITVLVLRFQSSQLPLAICHLLLQPLQPSPWLAPYWRSTAFIEFRPSLPSRSITGHYTSVSGSFSQVIKMPVPSASSEQENIFSLAVDVGWQNVRELVGGWQMCTAENWDYPIQIGPIPTIDRSYPLDCLQGLLYRSVSIDLYRLYRFLQAFYISVFSSVLLSVNFVLVWLWQTTRQFFSDDSRPMFQPVFLDAKQMLILVGLNSRVGP